jgi:hypothetical protein
MKKLNVSVGILSWKSPKTVYNTLNSYKESGLLSMVNDVTIFFQEYSGIDKANADFFKIEGIYSESNIGIGKAFTKLVQSAKTSNILLLENDWVCIEPSTVVYEELNAGISLLENKQADMVKYRHRKNPGEPLYTRQYKGREFDSPKHLFECVHWVEHPDKQFPEYISKDPYTNFYLCKSKYANHTNNPTMFKTRFYIDNVSPFSGEGIDLEGKIDGWWQEQDFKVAHGSGLFTHDRLDRL